MDKVKFIDNCNQALSIYKRSNFREVKLAFPTSSKELLRIYIWIGNLNDQIKQDYIDHKLKYSQLFKVAQAFNRANPINPAQKTFKEQVQESKVEPTNIFKMLNSLEQTNQLMERSIDIINPYLRPYDSIRVYLGISQGLTISLMDDIPFEKIEKNLEEVLWAFLSMYNELIAHEDIVNKFKNMINMYCASIFDINNSMEVKKMKKQAKNYSERAKKAWETRKANTEAKITAETELKAKRVAAAHKAWVTIRANKVAAEVVALTPAQKAWATRRANVTK